MTELPERHATSESLFGQHGLQAHWHVASLAVEPQPGPEIPLARLGVPAAAPAPQGAGAWPAAVGMH
jgi:hypothetical protein